MNMKRKYALLALAVFAVSLPMSGQKNVKAAYTEDRGDAVVWTTDGLEMPKRDLHSDVCGHFPAYLDGAMCYRICGWGLKSSPVRQQLQWRISGLGHDAPFTDCDKDKEGCWAGHGEYYADKHEGCLTAMIWKAAGPGTAAAKRDFRIINYLK